MVGIILLKRILINETLDLSVNWRCNNMFDKSCNTCICNKCLHNTKYGFNQCFDCRDCYEGNNHCEECSMFEEDDDEE